MKLLASVFLLLGSATAELCLPDCSSGRCIFDFNVRLTAGQLGKISPAPPHNGVVVIESFVNTTLTLFLVSRS